MGLLHLDTRGSTRPGCEGCLQIFQRQCGKLGFCSFVLSSGRNECHKLPLNGFKIDAASISFDLGDQQSSIQLILGNQINLILAFSVPPIANPRPFSRLRKFLPEISSRICPENTL